jgi:hypothetical protein
MQLDLLHLTNPSRELLYETRLSLKRTRVPAMNEDITLFLFDNFLVLVKTTTTASESAAAARSGMMRGVVAMSNGISSGGVDRSSSGSADDIGVNEEEDNTGTVPLLRNTVKSKYQYQIYKDVSLSYLFFIFSYTQALIWIVYDLANPIRPCPRFAITICH